MGWWEAGRKTGGWARLYVKAAQGGKEEEPAVAEM